MAQAKVRYKGLADERRISPDDVKSHGVNLSKEIVWNRQNGYAVVLDIAPAFEKILRGEGHFSIHAVADDGSDGAVIAAATDIEDTGNTVVDATTGQRAAGTRRS